MPGAGQPTEVVPGDLLITNPAQDRRSSTQERIHPRNRVTGMTPRPVASRSITLRWNQTGTRSRTPSGLSQPFSLRGNHWDGGCDQGPGSGVVLCTPLTPETRGRIGTKELGRMRHPRPSSVGPAREHDGTIRGPIQGSVSANSALMHRPSNRPGGEPPPPSGVGTVGIDMGIGPFSPDLPVANLDLKFGRVIQSVFESGPCLC